MSVRLAIGLLLALGLFGGARCLAEVAAQPRATASALDPSRVPTDAEDALLFDTVFADLFARRDWHAVFPVDYRDFVAEFRTYLETLR